MGNAKGDAILRLHAMRRDAYRVARDLGNVEAAEKGPTSYGKRVARRAVYRKTNGALARFLRRIGV